MTSSAVTKLFVTSSVCARQRVPTSATPFDGGAAGAASPANVGDSLTAEYLKNLTERMRVEDDDIDSDTAEYLKNLTEQMRVADAARDDRDIASYESSQRRLAACGALSPPTHRDRKRKHCSSNRRHRSHTTTNTSTSPPTQRSHNTTQAPLTRPSTSLIVETCWRHLSPSTRQNLRVAVSAAEH